MNEGPIRVTFRVLIFFSKIRLFFCLAFLTYATTLLLCPELIMLFSLIKMADLLSMKKRDNSYPFVLR